MAKVHSSRKRPASRARIDSSKPTPTRKAAAENPDLDEILGHFSDALALAETAYSALETAQEDDAPIAPGVLTLQWGIEELKRVYTQLDLAILRLE